MPTRINLLSGLATVAIVASASATPAYAQQQQQTYSFDIPAQDLGAALRAFAARTRIQVIFDGEAMRGKRSRSLKGRYSADAALAILLRGSGMAARRNADGVLVVFRGQEQASAASEEASLGAGEPTSSSGEQDPTSGDIVVTGTRIRGTGRAPSPVYSFDREDFAQQGADSVQQVLRTLPQNFTGGASEQAAAIASSRNGGNTNLGFGAGVNLRGLGTESTLVLLNGRRLAPSGLGNFVDISTIPLSAVERIDVVPDGASAIYGSDAVGGVVNLILRDNFEGAETQLRYGSVTDGSLRQFSASQLLGMRWTSGSILVNLDYGTSEPLLATERPFATGLQNGISYLSPSNERLGVLISGHQSLTPSLRLSALLQASARDSDNRTFQNSFGGRQNEYEGSTDQVGGTLSLDWRIGETWSVTLAQSEHRNKSVRINNLGASATVAASQTEVRTRHGVSSTELEAEGALFALPAGSARLALGAERREESLRARRVNVSGAPFAPLEREVRAGYAELFVPIFGDANEAPLARRLNFTLAARYEDYSDAGDADTYKLGALWSPFDGLNLRATYGTSFRAPYLYQLDRSQSQGIVLAPSSTIPLRLAYILSSPDPDLGPENATTWSAGLDVDQDVLGLRLSATYFGIKYEDRIGAARPIGNVVADPVLSALVSIPPDPEVLAAIEQAVVFINVSGQPLSAAEATFDGRTRNQARTDVSGLDLTLERTFDTRFGTISAGANASYLIAFEVSAVEGAPLVDIVDTIYNPVDLRTRAHLTWSHGGWSASAFLNYVDDYTDNQVPTSPVKVSSWTTLDLGLGYRFEENAGPLGGLAIRLNVQNAFDKDPPRILDRTSAFGNPGYDTENANPIGRLVSLTVSKTW